MGKHHHLEVVLRGQERQQTDFIMADYVPPQTDSEAAAVAATEDHHNKKRKNSSGADSALKSVKSAVKKGIKMGTTGFQNASKKKPTSTASPDMFEFTKPGEASALGFEPLTAQSEKPAINVIKLSEYSQVSNQRWYRK